MLNTSDFIFIFFFFQAEDGIRDWSVNGVQTCALPIWKLFFDSQEESRASQPTSSVGCCQQTIPLEAIESIFPSGRLVGKPQVESAQVEGSSASGSPARSEERRVGKECRSRRAQDGCKE